MGWTDDLLVGIAEHLAASGAGVWQESGAYPTGTTAAIFIMSVPSAPDVAITLSPYGIDDSAGLTDSAQGLQVRYRGPKNAGPRPVTDCADRGFDALQGLHGVELNGIPVVLVQRTSWTPLGVDGNSRHERSDNYRIDAIRPSTHRFD